MQIGKNKKKNNKLQIKKIEDKFPKKSYAWYGHSRQFSDKS